MRFKTVIAAMRLQAALLLAATFALVGSSEAAYQNSGYWYPNYGGWRQCWTTMSGIGVCVRRPYTIGGPRRGG